jgi:hypothetical protein
MKTHILQLNFCLLTNLLAFKYGNDAGADQKCDKQSEDGGSGSSKGNVSEQVNARNVRERFDPQR